MSDPVQDQYDAYPYPARDPAEERTRLVTGSPSNLDELNHYVFAGRRNFARPFRALVAGGGTGDAAIMLAQQLADRGEAGEVVYLDVSQAPREIAQARARERGLGNIAFHTASILDLPSLGLGTFDYIDCCGVLHHLEDPARALAVLAGALAEDGGIGAMVYAPHGRTGVYPAQAVLRALGEGLPLSERVALARRLLQDLPKTNWLRRNAFCGDHRRSDAELVDLLLHPRDRAFSIGELARLVDSADLRLVGLIEPIRYDPAIYLSDPALLARLDGLDWLRRAAVAEDLAGNIKTHVFYAVKRANERETVARADDGAEGGAAVPVLRALDAETLAGAAARDGALTLNLDGIELRLPLPPLAARFLPLIDGRRTRDEILASVRAAKPGIGAAECAAQFDRLAGTLIRLNHLHMRAPA